MNSKRAALPSWPGIARTGRRLLENAVFRASPSTVNRQSAVPSRGRISDRCHVDQSEPLRQGDVLSSRASILDPWHDRQKIKIAFFENLASRPIPAEASYFDQDRASLSLCGEYGSTRHFPYFKLFALVKGANR